MHTLNLGILAHVDAGKTSLTERLLHTAGIVDEPGRVDDGNTQTDTLALERQRGITIKSAVVSFALDDITVNLIDTPGHPDFIAEVERVLSVLDGAVLVVSAVEGVQPQTRVLMRALRRLRIPTLLFVNKIDRRGASHDRVLRALAAKLTPAIVPMAGVRDLGTRAATSHAYDADDRDFTDRLLDQLSLNDEELLADYLQDPGSFRYPRLRTALAEQTGRALIHPVYFGSAMTGEGVDSLVVGLKELLPAAVGDPRRPVSGQVFKVDRGRAGEKIAYVRMRAGSVGVRERLRFGGKHEAKVTSVAVFTDGSTERRPRVRAGEIGQLCGLDKVRVGDIVGDPAADTTPRQHFAPPTLETAVRPQFGHQRGELHVALSRLAEQDPLIDLRLDEQRGQLHLSLYGEVQKEVIQATLAEDFDVQAVFEKTRPICVERVLGSGAAAEFIDKDPNPFLATVGLRVDPAPPGSGVDYRLEVELGSMPYALMRAVEDAVRDTLRQGPHGWEIPDCVVTMTHSGYYPRQSHSHAVFDKSMSSTAGDFRQLTPLVLMEALRRAGTEVCEPLHHFQLEAPAEAFTTLLPVLSRLGAVPDGAPQAGETYSLTGEIPAGSVHELEQRLPGLTGGEGVWESAYHRHHPVTGTPPTRERTDRDPTDRKAYLLRGTRRVVG